MTAKWGAEKEWDFGLVLGNEFNHENRRYWDYDGSGLAFYGQPVIGNASSIDVHSEYNAQERTLGTFGQLSLSWKDMLYLTVTGRNDIGLFKPDHFYFCLLEFFLFFFH